jgi:predicted acetyltransferase
VGYGVRPAHRRRGHAAAILRQALEVTDSLGIERVLVTCDDDNVGSARTIEGAGGVLENVVPDGDNAPKRRYWIDRTAQVDEHRGVASKMNPT